MNSKDTAILKYAEYIENDNKLRYNILREKGLDVKENQSLNYYTDKMQELPDTTNETVIYDSFINNLEIELQNDPLLIVNGGTWYGMNCYVVDTKYSETTLSTGSSSSSANYLVVTSDEQELNPKNNNIITWDTSKDILHLDDGTKVRWIKIYYSTSSAMSVTNYSYLEQSDSVLAAFFDSPEANFDTKYSLMRYIICTERCTSLKLGATYAYLEYIKIYGNVNFNINSIFKTNLKSIIGPGNITNFGTSVAQYYYKLTELDLSKGKFGGAQNPFYAQNLKRLILPNMMSTVPRLINLPTILNLTVGNAEKVITIQAPILIELDIPDNFVTPLDISQCFNLSSKNILKIFNKLPVLTTSLSITLPQYMVHILTDEDIAIATNKNWTITFKF